MRYLKQHVVHLLMALLCLIPALSLTSSPAHALSDREIIRAFNLTVFGSEISPFGIQALYIHKFPGTVRFYVHDLADISRKKRVERFILSLNSKISGLKTQIVRSPGQANFNVYIVDRNNYRKTAFKHIRGLFRGQAPGKCMVRSVFSRRGISRSDAIIVSDEGERLFRRCMIEEILQGLGPLNEDYSLTSSMFNDRSTVTHFSRLDRYILNLLYDPRVRMGSSKRQTAKVLPGVLRDVRKRLK